MSESSLEAFLEMVQANPDLLGRLQAEDADPVEIAKELGFDISDELDSVELDDEALADVAGGRRRRLHKCHEVFTNSGIGVFRPGFGVIPGVIQGGIRLP